MIEKFTKALKQVRDETASYPDKTLLSNLILGLENIPAGLSERIEQCYQAPEPSGSTESDQSDEPSQAESS